MIEPTRFYTLAEAAAHTGVSEKLLRELVDAGEIGVLKTGGRNGVDLVLVPGRALELWAEHVATRRGPAKPRRIA